MRIRPRSIVRGSIPASEIEGAYRKAFGMGSTPAGFAEVSSIRGLKSIVKRAVGADMDNPFYFADSYYQPANEVAIRQVMAGDKTEMMKYIAEDFDCDDFSFSLMGAFHRDILTAAMPIFITWAKPPDTDPHALLSYYINGQVKLIEPQNDQIYSVPAGWELILLCG